MKALLFHCTFVYCVLSSLPNRSLACKCKQPTLDEALYNPDSTVIVGRIIDELKLVSTTSMDETMDRLFAFRVKHVYKAPCSIQKGDVIIVSTGASSASCGLDLKPNTRYTFSAFAEQYNFLLPAVVQVSVGSCAYNVEGELPIEDKQTLRKYNNETEPYTKKCTSTPCQTGADCDQKKEYCNVATNQCVAIDAPCPSSPVLCVAAPCEMTDPCQEAVGPLTCLDNYCGGCNAIFLDANRTQVCNSSS